MAASDSPSPSAAPHSQPPVADSLTEGPPPKLTTLVARSVFGGTLMGLANLVPGISGGTMLLAAGIYPRFVDAVAELTRFRIRQRSVLVLGCVLCAAVLSILLLAGTLKDLVIGQRVLMYSLFIGLTLGGVPVVWNMARPGSLALGVAAVIAFLGMVTLAVLQAYDVVGNTAPSMPMFAMAGLLGASAMILPGLSGGYLLLLIGQYVPILSAIDRFKQALQAGDLSAAMTPALTVMLPVGLGVVAGVVLIGNLLQWLLHRHQKPTLGALLGLLIGSTAGLWPFQVGVEPQVGDWIKGQEVTAETIGEIEPEDWKVAYFTPTAGQVGASLAVVLLGFGLTVGVSRIGRETNPRKRA